MNMVEVLHPSLYIPEELYDSNERLMNIQRVD